MSGVTALRPVPDAAVDARLGCADGSPARIDAMLVAVEPEVSGAGGGRRSFRQRPPRQQLASNGHSPITGNPVNPSMSDRE